MTRDNALLVLAVAGAVSLALGHAASASGRVLCYGIAKAGQNDCASRTGKHDCAGRATVAYSGYEWKYVDSRAACKKAGGKTSPFKGKTFNLRTTPSNAVPGMSSVLKALQAARPPR